MSKAVLISIRPKWCELIANGKKTIEIRKTRPKIETPFKCYMYMSAYHWAFSLLREYGMQELANRLMHETGEVIGEFVCDYTQTIYFDSDVRYGIDHPNDYGKWLMDASGVTLWEMLDYLDGKDGVYWHISALKIYDEPKMISEFHSCSFCDYRGVCPDGSWCKPLKRPPQSWCYVEEV